MRIFRLSLVISVIFWSMAVAQVPRRLPAQRIPPMPAEGAPGAPAPEGNGEIGDGDMEPKPLTDQQKQTRFASSPLVVVAKVVEAQRSQIQTMIWPPRINYFLKFAEVEILRGSRPADGESFTLTLVGQNPVPPAVGDKVVFGASKEDGRWLISVLDTADEARIKSAKLAVSVPLGWKIVDGKPVSPWAAKNLAWPKDSALKAEVICSRTARPALQAGGATIAVEQVKPDVVKKYQNPFGDGVFKVTITNPTDKPLVVPALLSDGKDILWADSLVFMVAGQAFTLPPSGKLDAKVESITLKPNQSISADINTLHLKGVSWPRGGSRVQITFCLGDTSQQNFFYYFSRHHDALIPK